MSDNSYGQAEPPPTDARKSGREETRLASRKDSCNWSKVQKKDERSERKEHSGATRKESELEVGHGFDALRTCDRPESRRIREALEALIDCAS